MMTKMTKKGFVLVEILTSLIVFSLGIVVLVQSLSYITRSSQALRDNHNAILLTDNILNRLYSKEPISDQGQQEIQGKSFYWKIEAGQPVDGIADIVVTVNWKTRAAEQQTLFEHRMVSFN